MSLQWKDKTTDQLIKAILDLKNKEKIYNFFEDIATVAEIKTFAQRLNVAKMLLEGNSYAETAKQTGASTATISRVKRTLDGGNGALKLALDNMRETEQHG